MPSEQKCTACKCPETWHTSMRFFRKKAHEVRPGAKKSLARCKKYQAKKNTLAPQVQLGHYPDHVQHQAE